MSGDDAAAGDQAAAGAKGAAGAAGVKRNTFRSLQNRNFKLYTIGQLISVTGFAMQQVAQSWLVLKLTDSGFALGVSFALQFLPILLFGFWGGLLADRMDKRRLLVFTQGLQGVLALALWGAVATGVVTLGMVYVLSFLFGFATCLDLPARQSFTIEMVGPENLANAVGLNSAVFNSGRLIGPAIAGILIAWVGVGVCFFVNGVTYAATIAALIAMRPGDLYAQAGATREKGQIREGLRYAWRHPVLRSTLFLVTIIGTFGFNFVVVLPLLAKETFGGGARLFGVLASLLGFGALIGALTAAHKGAPTRRVLLTGAAAFGVSACLVAVAPNAVSACVLIVAMGAFMMVFLATANSTLQLTAEPQMRGRVMALYGLVFLGSTPVGGPIIGFVSQQWSARAGLAVGGVASLAAAVFAAAPVLRQRRQAGLAALALPGGGPVIPVDMAVDAAVDGPIEVVPAPGGGLTPGDPVEAA